MQRGAGESGEIGAVVYDEQRARIAAQFGDAFQLREHFTREKSFVAELEDLRAAFEDLFGGGHRIDAVARGDFRVQDRIETARQHARAPGPDRACRAGRSG